MILINDNWETINDLHDVSRIVREYYNRELADKMDSLIEVLEDKIEYLEDELDDSYSEIRLLKSNAI